MKYYLKLAKILTASIFIATELFAAYYNLGAFWQVSTGWRYAGPASIMHWAAAVSSLPDGRILIAGGITGAGGSNVCEIYDPTTASLAPTGNLITGVGYPDANLLPNGKVFLSGGIVDVPGTRTNTTQIYDPALGTWSAGPTMNSIRSGHRSVLLPSGRVAIFAGSTTAAVNTNTIDIYDYNRNTIVAGPTLPVAPNYFGATLMANGKVLVSSGYVAATGWVTNTSLYDYWTNTVSATGAMTTARDLFGQALLPNGKVLAAGGRTGGATETALTEIYDPTATTWSSAGSLSTAKALTDMALLPDGKMLVAGGHKYSTSVWQTASELYDYSGNTWALSGPLNVARGFGDASALLALLPNGTVFNFGANGTDTEIYRASGTPAVGINAIYPDKGPISGGQNVLITGYGFLPTATANVGAAISCTNLVFIDAATLICKTGARAAGTVNVVVTNPNGQTATLTNGYTYSLWSHTLQMATTRWNSANVTLQDGRALITGGYTAAPAATATAEIYDAVTQSWYPTGNMATARYAHDAILLPNGKVLASGGLNAGGAAIASTEVYDPATGAWSAGPNLSHASIHHTSTIVPNGTVVIMGGRNGATFYNNIDLYNYSTNTITVGPNCANVRANHSATSMANGGYVLFAGGQTTGGTSIATVDYYYVAPNTCPATNPLPVARSGHGASLLPNGKALIVGGHTDSTALATAVLWDPSNATWSATTNNLSAARWFSGVSLLPTGKVLIAGGHPSTGNYSAAADLYDYTTNTFTATTSMAVPRADNYQRSTGGMVLLPSGDALYPGGGSTGGVAVKTAEVYSPAGAKAIDILTITPAIGPIGGGNGVIIHGSGFVPTATVSIGGVACTNLVFIDGASLFCTPGAHASGLVDVVVTNPDSSTDTLTNSYRYALAGTSCAAILTANPGAPDGTYAMVSGNNNYGSVECDMTTDGGGWTLASHYNYAGSTWVSTAWTSTLASTIATNILSLETRTEVHTATRVYKRFLKNNGATGTTHAGATMYFAQCKQTWGAGYAGNDWGLNTSLSTAIYTGHADATNKGSGNYKYNIMDACHRSLTASDASVYRGPSNTYYGGWNAYCGALHTLPNLIYGSGCASPSPFEAVGPEGQTDMGSYSWNITGVQLIKIWIK